MGVIDQDLTRGSRHAYLIGIGGCGMSALARVLKHRGLAVSGSDRKDNTTTRDLVREGIPVFIGQGESRFGDADLIIYSSAIRPDHVEFAAARHAHKKVYHRAQVLASLFNHAQTSIAITGTHGKTTTSSMISFVLSELGKNPTCLVGGDVVNLGTNTVLGSSDLFVSEVDESDQTHEFYAPNYAVLTNLEEDHMDHYKDLEALKRSFEKFLSNARDPGVIIYAAEDTLLREMVTEGRHPQISFGFSESADFSAADIQATDFGCEFDLLEAGFFVTRLKLSVPGKHNVANALAAVALLVQLGVDPEEIRLPLERFRGARRRLEIKWQSADLMVIDDYAHHPTEVRASIRALRGLGKHLTVVFQPHRFSRTRHFFKDFGRAFDEADELILTEIYAAGEENPDAVGVRMIYDEVIKSLHPAVQILEKGKVTPYLCNRPRAGGIVVFIGAGDIGEIADEFANRFKILATA